MTELQRPGFLLWKKSTASGSGNCVEVAKTGEVILLRDSKDLSRPALTFSSSEWEAFLADARVGQFNL